MWRCFVLVFLAGPICNILSAAVESPENVRVARQLRSAECCPCDTTERRAWTDQDKAADSTASVRGVVDDCPCRGRSADADGAASILFPNAVRALRPLLKSNEAKKDLKPLLHPEVDLASSVLSTLKEVTEEDYQEALARDAARSAAKMLERDTQPDEEDKNVVTIVLDPNSDTDFVAQESHNQESRCVHPLGNARSSSTSLKNTPSLLDALWYPSNIKPIRSKSSVFDRDSIVDASNIYEQTTNMEPNFGVLSNLDNAVSPGKTSERVVESPKSDFHEILSRPIKTLLKLRDVELVPKNVFGESSLAKPQDVIPPIDLDEIKQRLNQLRIPNLIKKIKRREPIQKIKPLFSKVDDSSLAASEVQEHLIDKAILQPDTIKTPLVKNTLRPTAAKGFQASRTQDIPLLSNIKKVNHSLHEKLSRIPNLLEGLRNQKNNLKNRKVSSTGIDHQEAGIKNTDLYEKLKGFREKTRKVLSERNILPNLKTPTVNANPVNTDFSKIDKFENTKKKESDTSGVQGTPTNKNLDVVFSASDNSITLMDFEKQLDACETKNVSPETEDLNEENRMVTTVPSVTATPSLTDSERGDNTDVSSIGNEDEYDENNNINAKEKKLIGTIKSPDENVTKITDEGCTVIDSTENKDISDTEISEVFTKSELNGFKSGKKKLKLLNQPVTRFTPQVKTTTEMQEINDKASTITDSLKNVNRESLNEMPDDLHLNEESKEDSCDEDNSNSSGDLSGSGTNQQPMTMQDLQNMSDSLLDQETQQKVYNLSHEQVEQRNEAMTKGDEPDFQTERMPKNLAIEQKNDGLMEISEKDEPESDMTLPESESLKNSKGNAENGKITCASDLALEKETPEVKDAITEASEFIPNTLRFPSRNRIVEPDSARGLNNLLNLPRPDLGNILNLNTKLPTLNEIHSKVASLHPVSKLSLASAKHSFEHTNDLIPDPSEREIKSVLPSRFSSEPLEIDVFQVNPQSSLRTSPLSTNLPRINLDTLRTKFAMPKSLGIKPLRLESAIGDKRGMVGASLLFGSDKKDLMKAEASSLLDRIRNSHSYERPIAYLPILEDLGSRMRERFSNLFDTNIIPTHLGSSSVGSLTDDLRSKAEERVKHLQNTLQNSMRKAKETSSNILSNAYAQPNDLIEEISQRHEDLTDKLKGIHYDLNDRLTSLHDSFLEKTKLPKLDFFQPKDVVNGFKLKPESTLQKYQPSLNGKRKVKKLVKNNANPTSRSNLERPKKFRMVPSASVQVPQTLKTPKLVKTHQDLTMQPFPRQAKLEIKKQNTASSNISPQYQLRSENKEPEFNLNSKTKHITPQFVPRLMTTKSLKSIIPNRVATKDLKELREAKSASGDSVASKLPTKAAKSFQRSLKSQSKSMNPEQTSLRKTAPPPILKPIKQLRTPVDLRKAFTLPNLAWPKATDNSFLNKVREALRTRLDGLKPVDTPKSIGKLQAPNASDMDRSASTVVKNIDASGQPIRENTSYKCKLICTKDSSEQN